MPKSRSKGKVPPGVDIEDLSRQKAKYFQVHAEETHYLAADPTARDKAIEKLYQNPEVKKGFPCAGTYIGPNDDPDAFLAAVDEVLDNPDRSIDQRVFRFHVAVSGLMVFNEHRLRKAVGERHDLRMKVNVRSRQIYREWMSKNLPPPSGVADNPNPAPPPPTPPPSRLPSTSIKAITSDVAEKILAMRDEILEMRFMLEANTPDKSAWQVESYLTKKGGVVEYNVAFEDCPHAIPHDVDGMRILLLGSHVLH
ncbi:hypothetical protein L226DRAFT_538788 [Lentinus tigrinus ALCF2SS1-7]|uniref:Uncharacterized protein n=1 Tax=Lentinus tigrinus ALCF2SS1-6 TaxID=1328759 RepID=A0A5C2RU78_9APHY|nr:hypothetical protein L227DRAFT_581096 [Lentinus tigrinus ALCF2SS1-6]RPD70512.1 hypothetical protein L226DRAFT_538788 [Lentinus tigrinus ALCF2SS1-7]